MNKKLIVVLVLLLLVGALIAGIISRATADKQAAINEQKREDEYSSSLRATPEERAAAVRCYEFTSPSGRYRLRLDKDTFEDLKMNKKVSARGSAPANTDDDPWGTGVDSYDVYWSPREHRFILVIGAGSDSGFSIFEIQNGAPIYTGICWENHLMPDWQLDTSYVMGHWNVEKVKWLDDVNALIKYRTNVARNWGEELWHMSGGPVNADVKLEYQYTAGKGLRIRSRDIIVETNQFKHRKVADLFNYDYGEPIDAEPQFLAYRGEMSPAVISKLRRRVTDKQDRVLLEELIKLNKACYK
jgi:type II secretory pathway pseudopilin PulG